MKKLSVLGSRKIHEEMITRSDSTNTWLKDNYIILPNDDLYKNRYQRSGIELIPVGEGFSYNSGTNNDFQVLNKLEN